MRGLTTSNLRWRRNGIEGIEGRWGEGKGGEKEGETVVDM